MAEHATIGEGSKEIDQQPRGWSWLKNWKVQPEEWPNRTLMASNFDHVASEGCQLARQAQCLQALCVAAAIVQDGWPISTKQVPRKGFSHRRFIPLSFPGFSFFLALGKNSTRRLWGLLKWPWSDFALPLALSLGDCRSFESLCFFGSARSWAKKKTTILVVFLCLFNYQSERLLIQTKNGI